jgi:hypothetical protein
MAISASAKRPRCWSLSLAGSACDCGLPSGANGKHHGVGELHSSHWESGGSCATWPAVAMDPGISPGAKPSRWDSPIPTSNRSVSHPCSARVSATSRTAVYGPVRTVGPTRVRKLPALGTCGRCPERGQGEAAADMSKAPAAMVTSAARDSGIKRALLAIAIGQGTLPAYRYRGRTLILKSDLQRFVARLASHAARRSTEMNPEFDLVPANVQGE